ncbi:MAG: hypothetical protein NTX50_23485 [Candidatus Sumerlaeota bacterium]|nr:hypothetical protein [Candidatus Sumerlaeota bacterium]
MAQITKQLAIKIAEKLEAKIISKHKKAHDLALIFHNGKMIAHFGIRRGSNKEMGHDHIPEQIFVGMREAKLLGQCPLQRNDWLEIIKKKGKI